MECHPKFSFGANPIFFLYQVSFVFVSIYLRAHPQFSNMSGGHFLGELCPQFWGGVAISHL
jgi:hypothetical protein